MTITLRRHQLEAADAVDDAFRAGINRPLANMCVSAGKSLFYAETSRRCIERGGRVLAVAPTRELVEQIESAALSMGLQVGVNSAALGKRVWRAPMIVASINSVHAYAGSFGPIDLLIEDEAHTASHGESGMLHTLRRGLGYPRTVGGTGTAFRLMGGSLVEGEGAPYDKIVYNYDIMDGIRDGYLVTPFSAAVDDKIDVTKLRVAQGEYTGASSDAQMITMIDNHIAQMLHYGRDRRTWLVFEASRNSAEAMSARMNEWGIPTGLVLGDRTRAEAANRKFNVEALRSGKLRALVNVRCLTTGFDVQEIDLLVCRRRTKSLSLWIQILGRLLRTIGGNIEESIRRGKADGLLLDFADNTSEFGPIDWIRPKDTAARLVSCDACNKRNAAASARCWSCDEPMTKLCPACLVCVTKGVMDCPGCGYDMRAGERGPAKAASLLETPSGAALISSYKTGSARDGGWLPILRVFGRPLEEGSAITAVTSDLVEHVLADSLADHARAARWIRSDGALLVPNGQSRNSVLQITADGTVLPVPMPGLAAA